MPAEGNQTTIRVSEPTKERLRKRGAKGETYEEIVVELLEIAENSEKN